MSTQDGTIEVAGMQLTSEQARQQAQAMMVNADEVVTETLRVKVRVFVDKPVLLDNGDALLDDQGNPLMYRECIGTRTARIQNLVPIDVYAKATAIMSFDSMSGQANAEQISAMGDLVWQVWCVSEEWMKDQKERLLNGGIDGDKVIELFSRFFDKVTRLQNA